MGHRRATPVLDRLLRAGHSPHGAEWRQENLDAPRTNRVFCASPNQRRDPGFAQRLFHIRFCHRPTARIFETQPGELRPRLNDGKVDRQGRFVAGSMDFEESSGVGKLFCLDTDRSVRTLDRDIICSNGPCFSPDARTFYFADTGRRVIYAYDYDPGTGNVRSRRVFASFEKLRGYPDGATVDEEGYVWSVEVYSGRLIRFDPMGVVDRIVGLPVQSTTSLTFGGANLDIAYITSMARPMNGQYHREQEAGCLFAVHGLGVRGLPEPRFAG